MRGVALWSRCQRVIALSCLSISALLLPGCISYTVGQTAETVPRSEQAYSSSVNLVPGTLGDTSNLTATRRPSLDTEFRFGVDDRTDVGFRIASYSGFMLTWKRQLTRADTSNTPENRGRTAFMLGGGLLNAAEHAAFEATLITSGKWTPYGQWYGAARVIQVLPITATAREDDPVFGVSFGHLFGDQNMSIGPEVGVYYDRSVLGLNTNRILVIPSLVLRKSGLPQIRRR
jgi:hypothetical protein